MANVASNGAYQWTAYWDAAEVRGRVFAQVSRRRISDGRVDTIRFDGTGGTSSQSLRNLNDADPVGIESRARWIVEAMAMALALQGVLVVQHAPREVAEAFCASRLAGDRGHVFGTLPPGLDYAAIVERHRPLL